MARQRFLDGDELVRLLAIAEDVAEWLPDFILWGVHSGMRKGEVRALLWSDIRTLEHGRTFAQVRTSKSDQPRIVTCTQTMKGILDRQQARRVEGDDRVFPISAMTLRRKWERTRRLAGLEDVTLHLRCLWRIPWLSFWLRFRMRWIRVGFLWLVFGGVF